MASVTNLCLGCNCRADHHNYGTCAERQKRKVNKQNIGFYQISRKANTSFPDTKSIIFSFFNLRYPKERTTSSEMVAIDVRL